MSRGLLYTRFEQVTKAEFNNWYKLQLRETIAYDYNFMDSTPAHVNIIWRATYVFDPFL